MNKSEQYVYEAIKNWVWSGFYNEADIQEMMDDILDGDCDEIPENMFTYKGTIDEVMDLAKKQGV